MQFETRVRNEVRQHGSIIPQPDGYVINFLSRSHGHLKAFSVKAHGHRSKDQVHSLENYQQNTKIPVILVSEQAGHIPRFEALNRYLKWRARIAGKYNREKETNNVI